MFKKVIILLLLILTKVSISSSYENFDIHIFPKFSFKPLLVLSYSKDSTSLKPEDDQSIIQASYFQDLSGLPPYAWTAEHWLLVKPVYQIDSNLTYKYKIRTHCIRNQLKQKCIEPPVIIDVLWFHKITRNSSVHHFYGANIFAVNISDSLGIALSIDTLFDGKSYGPRQKHLIKRDSVNILTYKAGLTTGTLICPGGGCRSQYFDTTFTTYPTYRLFHVDNGEGVFIISGGDPEKEGDLVCEFSITKMGGQYKKFFNDLVIGDSVVHQTIYSVDGSYVKRNRIETDEKTGRRMSYKARYHGMWLPDNEKESK